VFGSGPDTFYNRIAKRWFDVVVSGAALVALSPVFAGVSLAVLRRHGRPILFRQERTGLHGERFHIVKFRTMTDERDEHGRPLPDKLRLTKLGKFLRETSLDELPELLNVLRGQMSLVGPRPLLHRYMQHYNERQKRRHDVRPGLTGWVAVNGRTPERVEEAVAKLHGDVVGVAVDVTTEDGAAQLHRELPDVDILVNNLGIFGAVPAREITDEQWRTYFDVNVLAAVRLIRMYLPGMTERGWGPPIQIASDSALVTPEEMIHYGVSKTALLAVSRGFAKDAAGTGVTVNSVIAGPTHTAGVEDFVYQLVDKSLPWEDAQREFMRKHRPQSLLQRLIEPVEIANMVTYLASPLASATTGGALRVDGGYVDSIVP